MLELIEERRWKNWFRTMVLMLAMLALMLTVGYIFLGWTGIMWAGILGGISIFFTYNVPTSMIMRMHRAQALGNHQLVDIQHLNIQFARKSGLPKVPRLYYIPSHQINAFATGSKEDPAIALTYGLIKSMNIKEIAGVLAHEISHIVNNDVKLQQMALLMTRFTRTFSIIGQILLILNLSSVLSLESSYVWVAISLLILAPYLANLLFMALSRTREYNADLQAAKITGDPNALADALERLHFLNRRRMNPFQRSLPVWLSTHPMIEDRVRRLRELAPKFELPFVYFNL